jgi:hypothetical protein
MNFKGETVALEIIDQEPFSMQPQQKESRAGRRAAVLIAGRRDTGSKEDMPDLRATPSTRRSAVGQHQTHKA